MIWDRVGIFLPTYNRAITKLPVCLKSIFECTSNINSIYIVFVLQDAQHDPHSQRVIRRMCGEAGVPYEILIDPIMDPSLARFYNLAYTSAKNRSESMLVSMVGDDMVWQTKGWEARLLEAVNNFGGDGLFYCAGDDRFDDALCVNAFMTRQWVDKCGGWNDKDFPDWVSKYNIKWGHAPFMCPVFQANGIDVVWQLIGDCTGTSRYLADVVIRHDQWSRAHIGQDETSQRLSCHRKTATRREHKGEDVVAADHVIKKLAALGIGDGRSSKGVRQCGIQRGYHGRYWITKDRAKVL